MTRIVAITGNHTRPSRTRVLVEAVLRDIERRGLGKGELHDIVDAGETLGTTFDRTKAAPALDRVLSAIEGSDVLVVGSPVYKGSYTGLFKHVFDLIDMKALVGRPVLLTATGKIDSFAHVIDFQLRPLFAFFGAFTLPLGVYVTEADFETPSKLHERVDKRIEKAVDALERLLGAKAQ